MFEDDDLDALPAATLCHLVDEGTPGNQQASVDDGTLGNRQAGVDDGTPGNQQASVDDGTPGNRQAGVDDQETLLIHKKRGVGSGQWVGPGGKVEAGETPRECVVREVREEVGIDVEDPEKVGVFVYRSEDWDAVVHVFRATAYTGTPEETAEADPAWFPVDDLPFEQMWATDREWLPPVLDGETFCGRFVYRDGEPDEVELETGIPPRVD